MEGLDGPPECQGQGGRSPSIRRERVAPAILGQDRVLGRAKKPEARKAGVSGIAKRGAKSRRCRSKLAVAQVLARADSHFQRTGQWPQTSTGPVLDDPNETWRRIDNGLRYGLRGLPAGWSLARPLDTERGVRKGSRPGPTDGGTGFGLGRRTPPTGWVLADQGFGPDPRDKG